VGDVSTAVPQFTPEHDALRDVVRDFATREIEPHAARWDTDGHFPVEVVQAVGELGRFSIPRW
jgi:butyryl-CoA dehydrogenase